MCYQFAEQVLLVLGGIEGTIVHVAVVAPWADIVVAGIIFIVLICELLQHLRSILFVVVVIALVILERQDQFPDDLSVQPALDPGVQGNAIEHFELLWLADFPQPVNYRSIGL